MLFFSDFFYLNWNVKEKTRFEVAKNKDFYNPADLNLSKINAFKQLATKGCFIGTSSVMFNKKIFNNTNNFNSKFKFLTDYLFFLNCAEKYNFYCSEKILSYWRYHDQQATSKLSKTHINELNLLYFKLYISSNLNFYEKFIILKKHLKLFIKTIYELFKL